MTKDGKQSWLTTNRTTYEYLHPGLYRQTSYDDAGNVSWVTIVDALNDKRLSLNMKEKKVDPRGPYLQAGFHPKGPFGWVSDALKTKPLEMAGQRQVNGRTANVVRLRQEKNPDKKRNTLDFWIDPESKQLVGMSSPGADVFDPATHPDRNNQPSKNWGMTTILGSITDQIVLNPPLDAQRFSLTPPGDFEVVAQPPTPPATEDDVISWLRAAARVNNDTFTDETPMLSSEPLRSAFNRVGNADLRARNIQPLRQPDDNSVKEPNAADKTLVALFNSYRAKRNNPPGPLHTPIDDFRQEQTIPNTFRYVGVGVKLGAADRIVCWYQLKNSGQYRAVYGDLTIKDVEPRQLRLPLD